MKCIECGLLEIRRQKTLELCEVPEEWRDNGGFRGNSNEFPLYSPTPLCLARKATFTHVREDIEVAINEERPECDEYGIPWDMGFTPKEHIEMHMLERRESQHREWMQKLDERDRTWRDADIARINNHRDDDIKRIERHHRWNYVLSGIAIFVSLVAAAISAGIIEIPWLTR